MDLIWGLIMLATFRDRNETSQMALDNCSSQKARRRKRPSLKYWPRRGTVCVSVKRQECNASALRTSLAANSGLLSPGQAASRALIATPRWSASSTSKLQVDVRFLRMAEDIEV